MRIRNNPDDPNIASNPTGKLSNNVVQIRDHISPMSIWELQGYLAKGEKQFGTVATRPDPPVAQENHGPQMQQQASGPEHPLLSKSVPHSGEDKKNTAVISNNVTAEQDLKDNLEQALANNPQLQLHPTLVNNPQLRMQLQNQKQHTPSPAPRLEKR